MKILSGLASSNIVLQSKSMTSSRSLLKREPARYNATILFCDIRGFSSLFDERDPMEALQFANTVLGELGNVVEATNGCIDKFTGDGFLAHFGVTEPNETHVQDACWCAIRMRDVLSQLNFSRHVGDLQVVSIGVGIHTGTVAGGVVSATSKSEFSIFGDVVNTAARIESLTKEFSVDCLVSESVYRQINKEFAFKEMPYRPLKGIKNAHLTYWLLPTNLFLDN